MKFSLRRGPDHAYDAILLDGVVCLPIKPSRHERFEFSAQELVRLLNGSLDVYGMECIKLAEKITTRQVATS